MAAGVTNLTFSGVFQAWRSLNHAGVLRRGKEAVAGSAGWKRGCKNNQSMVQFYFKSFGVDLCSFLCYFYSILLRKSSLLKLVFELILEALSILVISLEVAVVHIRLVYH